MLREIKLYGRLSKFLKRRIFRAEVSSAAEAIRFLLANFPHLEPELARGYYRVSVGDYDLSLEEIEHPSGMQVIKIIPVISGSGGVAKILAGIALIALAIAVPTLGGGLTAATIFGTKFTTLALASGLLGASLVLGGVAQLLTPVPKFTTRDPKQSKSYSFSGIQNTSGAGTPVPVVYGEIITGSVEISKGIDTVQVKK